MGGISMASGKKARTTSTRKEAETRRKEASKAQEEAQQSQAEASEAQDNAAKALAEEQGEPQEGQEGSQPDSNDQPAPTETERREEAPRKEDADSEPRRQESETADDEPEQPQVDEGQPEPPREFVEHVVNGGRSFRADVLVDDQNAVEAQRQDELAMAREEHNRRSGMQELVSSET
jgi:hypothetical protein